MRDRISGAHRLAAAIVSLVVMLVLAGMVDIAHGGPLASWDRRIARDKRFRAYGVDLTDGHLLSYSKLEKLRILCVRGPGVPGP